MDANQPTNQSPTRPDPQKCPEDGRCRKLTAGELNLAREIFKPGVINYDRVRVMNHGYFFFQVGGSVMAPDGFIYPGGTYRQKNKDGIIPAEDFSNAGRPNKALFVHELVHIWQYQNGVKVRRRAFVEHASRVLIGGAYRYDFDTPGKTFRDYGVEQQAAIVEDYYWLTKGRPLKYSLNFKGKKEAPSLLELREFVPIVKQQ